MSDFVETTSELFSERLCDLLQENKSSVAALAGELSLNPSAIYKWMRKVSVPSFENALILADNFGCSLDYLFGMKEIDVQYTPHSPFMPFCEHFERILQEKDVSEYRLVRMTGISRSKITAWRKGESLPSMHSLIVVASALDMTLDALVGRD